VRQRVRLEEPPPEGSLHLVNSLLHVTFVALLGALLGQRPPLLWGTLAAFAVSSKLFALQLEASLGRRGPSGMMSLAASLGISSGSLIFLGWPSSLLGLAVLALYATYPRPVSLGERPVLDIAHHGIRYCLLFLLGYGLSFPLAQPASYALMAIFTSSVAGEILYRLRRGGDGGTVARLGTRTSSALALAFLALTLLLGYLFLNSVYTFKVGLGALQLSVYDVAIPALGLYLATPLLGELVRRGAPLRALVRFNRRELTAAVLVALISLYLYAQAGAVAVGREDGADFLLDLKIRVLVAGSHSWDVPWIWFRFKDYCNSYYVLLQTNGILELGKVVRCQKAILGSVQTSLSPFREHEYRILAQGSRIEVSVDGLQYFNVTDSSLSSGKVVIGLPGMKDRSYPMTLGELRYQALP